MSSVGSIEKKLHELGNGMGVTFWDSKGVLFINYLSCGHTITCRYYCMSNSFLRGQPSTANKFAQKKSWFTQDLRVLTSLAWNIWEIKAAFSTNIYLLLTKNDP